MERFKQIICVYLLLIRDGKIFLLRRFNTGYEDGSWGLPAGHVEDNEAVSRGLVREAKEEIGIVILPKDLDLVHVLHRKENDIRMDLFFTVKNYSGTPMNTEPEKCDAVGWFELDDLPTNVIGYIRDAIEAWQKKQLYAEIGFRD